MMDSSIRTTEGAHLVRPLRSGIDVRQAVTVAASL